MSALDSELDWCLEKGWNSGLPERTPLCTAGCEGFLHLPLSNQQQTPQCEEPFIVLGIDLRALDNTLETNTIGKKYCLRYVTYRNLKKFRKRLQKWVYLWEITKYQIKY